MNTSKLFAILLVLLGGTSLPTQTPAAVPPDKKAAEEKPVPPIVRMDLLEKTPVETGPPKRNIFSPRASMAGQTAPFVSPAGAAGPGSGVLPPAGLGGAAADQATAQPPAAPAFTVDLRYVGFVNSQKTRKIIGLVVFQGQARAVVEGEVLSEGIRIGKISKEEIEVIMPDSSTRTFSLEGEDQ